MALQESDCLFVWPQTRLPLCSLSYMTVYDEVAGSGRLVKRCTRVRSEVFSLYGNGVRAINTVQAACVLEIFGKGAHTEL